MAEGWRYHSCLSTLFARHREGPATWPDFRLVQGHVRGRIALRGGTAVHVPGSSASLRGTGRSTESLEQTKHRARVEAGRTSCSSR